MFDDAGTDAALEFIGEAINRQQCILFLGAGVHAPPPDGSGFEYPSHLRPPVGSQLSKLLAERCQLSRHAPDEDPENLQRVSLFYEITRNRAQLVESVVEAVHAGKQPSPMLRALAELDFPLIITTNYDQLLEQALRDVDKQPRQMVYTPSELVPTPDRRDQTVMSPIVVKLHGDVFTPESIVITDEDYIRFVLRMNDKLPYNPIPLSLKFFLTGWTTLFVGYSLLDYNLRLLFMTLRWGTDKANLPAMYSVDFHPDPLILSVWDNQQRYLKFIVQDVWEFVPRLYRLVRGKEFEQ